MASLKPGVVRKLDETVVNRIAAGEVIQRPANAIKEMLENSLDAGATNINVVVKQGGLKMINITDNGSGIRREDLPIVCHRFTTSKLREFSDLKTIATYGFRGEALASITHVAHVTLTTRTAADKCSYKASYMDGELKAPPAGCAGNIGTSILVEDLFYNVSTRRNALKSPSEEYAKIWEVISRYAVHNPQVSISLKKMGETGADLKTPGKANILDNIRLVFGTEITREVVPIKIEDTSMNFKLEGYVSNPNYSTKRTLFILFINHRLVDSPAIRKALEEIYTQILPKQGHPFIYLSLELPPQNVDVNVHPTKHEVFFLHQDDLVQRIKNVVESHVNCHPGSRTFYTKLHVPSSSKSTPDEGPAAKSRLREDKEGSSGRSDQDKEYAHDMVRNDSRLQKIDKFVTRMDGASIAMSGPDSGEEYVRPWRSLNLTSIAMLKKEVENSHNDDAYKIISDSTFVSCATPKLAMFQFQTCLYMGDICKMSREFFYQILLYDFGNFGFFNLDPVLPLVDLMRLGLDFPEIGCNKDASFKVQLAEKLAQTLFDHREMLADYFSLTIDENGSLETMPLLLKNFTPDGDLLPPLMVKLARDVVWDCDEKECFRKACTEIAKFYGNFWKKADILYQEQNTIDPDFLRTIENVLWPALKQGLATPGRFNHDGTLLRLANTKDLYKVFERC